MLFKEYFYLNEGMLKVPVEDIRTWVESHYVEFVTKLKETLKNGYGTDVSDYLVLKNPYTNENIELSVEIQKSILSSNEGGSLLRFDKQNNRILINATNFFKAYKNDLKTALISGIIHEVAHAIDPGVAGKHKKFVPGSYDDIINSDIETVAFNREFIDRIKNLDSEKKARILDRIRKGKAIGIKDVDDYYSSLNPKNKTKFINQLVKEIL
jgi:hypothetical protein